MEVHATDGIVGSVDSCFFDDQRWVVRYLTVNRGSKLKPDQVLVSPILIDSVDNENERIDLLVDRKAIDNSPNIDTHQPVSRRMEEALVQHYGHSLYWVGNNIWGGYVDPKLLAGDMSQEEEQELLSDDNSDDNRDESHLRSYHELKGYRVRANDGVGGHIADFLIEEGTWKIVGIIIDKIRLLPSKQYYLEIEKIKGISWSSSEIDVSLSKAELENLQEIST